MSQYKVRVNWIGQFNVDKYRSFYGDCPKLTRIEAVQWGAENLSDRLHIFAFFHRPEGGDDYVRVRYDEYLKL